MITKKTPLKEVLKIAEQCDKCGHCCTYGTGLLVEGDVEKIAKFLGVSEEKLKEKYLDETEQFNKKVLRPKKKKEPYGKCIFLKGNTCKIHSVKPLHCRVGNCRESGEELSVWYMLNYLVDPEDPESIRQYKIYIDSRGKTIPGGKLEELVPDKEKLKKILSFELLR